MAESSAPDPGQEIRILVSPMRNVLTDPDRLIEGSRVIRATCGHLSWLSPQGAAFVSGRTWESYCTDCSGLNLNKLSDLKKLTGIVPGALDAAAAAMDRDQALRVRMHVDRAGLREFDNGSDKDH